MPRAGLSEARVVDEAQLLADEVGLSQLTLAALAGRLGVRQPSLYKHVESIDDLRRSLAHRAKDELADTLTRAAVGRAGPDAVASMARAYRAWALDHPGRYAAAQRGAAPDDRDLADADRRMVEVVTDVLSGYGLTGDDAIDATRALRAALHGFVSLEGDGGFGLPLDIDRSFARLVDGLTRMLTDWMVPAGAAAQTGSSS